MNYFFRIAALLPMALVAQEPAAPPAQQPKAHFHHVALNVTDREDAVHFLVRRFECEAIRLPGKEDAVWTGKSYILFNQVKKQPPSAITSTLWHIGWGAENMPAAYKQQLAMETPFVVPLTDISKLAGREGFFYAYVDGPNHALIEMNTAPHHHFGHVHFLSDDPLAAGQWYADHFGINVPKGSPDKKVYEGYQVGPASSFMVDDINFIIYPAGYLEKQSPSTYAKHKQEGFDPTTGRVIDHIGLSVDNLDETLARLEKEGVKVIEKPARFRKTTQRAATIEGPDRLAIQIVEGHAKKD